MDGAAAGTVKRRTSPGERVLTEGYIFGNVTGDNGSGAGTLALLPRQFFLDLYKYRRRAALDPNLACRLMFQVSYRIL
ncbi:hypothetical protein E2C01_020677 [Portunus trituberculatus]|uniref:Uncharacterized protein n=1 Tax=Portunus trituberculatus TaxID=210409 RepID=A0A5B7E2E2_PORTR|nr:hypothetical protein [Portunus trituberculatus]